MSKKVKSNIMDFSSFVNENYTFEDFTAGDMEDVKDLYNDGITDAKEISRETGLSIDVVTQILSTLTKKNESEVFGEHEEEQTDCDCDICNSVGECNCDCCCSDKCSNGSSNLFGVINYGSWHGIHNASKVLLHFNGSNLLRTV